MSSKKVKQRGVQFNAMTLGGNRNELIPDYQSAFRQHYSCETALTHFMNVLLWAMEKQEVTAFMAIDLNAAFDTVDHDILLSVLKAKFGIGRKSS